MQLIYGRRSPDWMTGFNNDNRTQSIDSIETYACGTSKDIVIKKKEIK